MVLRCDEERVAARAEPMVKCEVSTLEYSHDFIGNVGIAMINHPFVMVYTTHLWWLGGWCIIAIPTLLKIRVTVNGELFMKITVNQRSINWSTDQRYNVCGKRLENMTVMTSIQKASCVWWSDPLRSLGVPGTLNLRFLPQVEQQIASANQNIYGEIREYKL